MGLLQRIFGNTTNNQPSAHPLVQEVLTIPPAAKEPPEENVNAVYFVGLDNVDDYFIQAGRFVIEKEKASIGMLQRAFKIGFNRAAKIMDQLCESGVVGPEDGIKPREVLMTLDELEALQTLPPPPETEQTKIDRMAKEIQESIQHGRRLLHIATTTTNEEHFYLALNGMRGIYQSLIPYEETFKFNITPTEMLKAIDNTREAQIEAFNNRVNCDFDKMDGHAFEHFCAELLKKNGYTSVTVTPGSGDQGIDIIAFRDGVKYGIQCKCYSSDIGNKAIQEAFSGAKFYDCHVPVVLTNRHFTASAKELSQKTNVLLWDRDRLLQLTSNSK